MYDIETRTRLKVGFEQSKVVQDFQTLSNVISMALGGAPQQSKGAAPDAFVPKNMDEMTVAFNAVFGNG